MNAMYSQNKFSSSNQTKQKNFCHNFQSGRQGKIISAYHHVSCNGAILSNNNNNNNSNKQQQKNGKQSGFRILQQSMGWGLCSLQLRPHEHLEKPARFSLTPKFLQSLPSVHTLIQGWNTLNPHSDRAPRRRTFVEKVRMEIRIIPTYFIQKPVW